MFWLGMLEHKEAIISPFELGIPVSSVSTPWASHVHNDVRSWLRYPRKQILVEPVFASSFVFKPQWQSWLYGMDVFLSNATSIRPTAWSHNYGAVMAMPWPGNEAINSGNKRCVFLQIGPGDFHCSHAIALDCTHHL